MRGALGRKPAACLTLATCLTAVCAAQLYQVVDPALKVTGPYDVNILADDADLVDSGTITNLCISLSITGSQECALWIFDGLGRAPLLVQGFTNVPSLSEFEFLTYTFPLNLKVPKNIYVGFSAQGDGWTSNGTDWISVGKRVAVGHRTTSGLFFYGPVAGGRLTTAYTSGIPGFFELEIRGVPDHASPHIARIAVSGGDVTLNMTELATDAPNIVERMANTSSSAWETAGAVTTAVPAAAWSERLTNSPPTLFYRIRPLL